MNDLDASVSFDIKTIEREKVFREAFFFYINREKPAELKTFHGRVFQAFARTIHSEWNSAYVNTIFFCVIHSRAAHHFMITIIVPPIIITCHLVSPIVQMCLFLCHTVCTIGDGGWHVIIMVGTILSSIKYLAAVEMVYLKKMLLRLRHRGTRTAYGRTAETKNVGFRRDAILHALSKTDRFICSGQPTFRRWLFSFWSELRNNPWPHFIKKYNLQNL